MADRNGGGGLIKLLLLIGLLGPLLVLAGAIGARFGLVDWSFGFETMTLKWALWAAMAGVAAGLLALILALRDFQRKGLAAVVALLAPAVTLSLILAYQARAQAAPPIHDAATDWTRPVAFSREAMAARAGAPNAVEPDPVVPADAGPPWGGRRVAEINAETCPGAKPILRHVNEDQVAAAFEAAGVEVSGRAPWRVEGAQTSFWYGVTDDIVARIGPDRTDIRSLSRVGTGDSGANCARVTKIVKALGG